MGIEETLSRLCVEYIARVKRGYVSPLFPFGGVCEDFADALINNAVCLRKLVTVDGDGDQAITMH